MGVIITLAYHGLYQEALAQQNNTIDESACLDKFASYLETFLTTPPEKLACSPPFVSAIGHDGSLYCLREASIDMLQNTGWRLEKTSYITTLNNTVCAQPTPQINNSTFIPQSVYGLQESMMTSQFSSSPSVLTSPRLGFAVGGAADINNFRENVVNNYLPLHTDITYEGLFYDYYFDTGADSEYHVLFCPSYSYAVSADPFSNKTEYYLSVGLNSGIKEADFGRKDLNLVIVMDVSGSMDSPFYTYYYDASQVTDHDTRTKMAIANEAVAGLLDHLGPDDNLGLVLFDNTAHIARPLGSMAFTDVNLLKSNIMGIYADGGTHMAAGMDTATLMLGDAIDGYENRIIFLTDAMPNQGDTTQDGLFGTISDNAKNGIYTTFIGIGVDLNTELVEALTKIRGANHYSVHSASEFKNRMVDEFEFMVTPLVFDWS
ncbi:MAG: VWA domain-containing protein [Cenarchaeum sp. SB0663_bin_5]|nr:VWA domain-containing protein [Cenarchaeum sp. SB0663_bin_5]